MESTLNGGIDSEIKLELLALVLWVSLKGGEDFATLRVVQLLSGNDGDLLLSIQFLVQLLVPIGNTTNIGESLVLGQNLEEFHGKRLEISNRAQSLVEKSDFLSTDTSVLSELFESLRVLVQRLKVNNILINGEKGTFGGSRREEDGGISTLNSVFLGWWLIIRGGFDNLNITNAESSEKILRDLTHWLRFGGTREISLGSSWLVVNNWFRFCNVLLSSSFFNMLLFGWLVSDLLLSLSTEVSLHS